MTTPHKAPPLATLLAIAIVLPGTFLGGAAGSWIVPLGLALASGGGPSVGAISTSYRVFAVLPESTVPWWSAAQLVLTAACVIGAMSLCFKLWRFVVVEKLAIMTDDDVREFYKRDPGF